MPIKIIKSGEPCGHKGCLHHVTHPCEKCGRIAGEGEAKIFVQWSIESHLGAINERVHEEKSTKKKVKVRKVKK